MQEILKDVENYEGSFKPVYYRSQGKFTKRFSNFLIKSGRLYHNCVIYPLHYQF